MRMGLFMLISNKQRRDSIMKTLKKVQVWPRGRDVILSRFVLAFFSKPWFGFVRLSLTPWFSVVVGTYSK